MPRTDTNNAPTGRICPECGVSFHTTHPTKRFCSNEHRQAFANREAAEGKVIASYAKAWRLKRGGKGVGKEAFAELCRILDDFNARDRAEGRPPVTGYVSTLLASGYTAADRREWNAKAGWRQRAVSPDATGSAASASV